jgi:hypothetical protein
LTTPVLNSAVGSATANSFGSLAEADAYHASVLHAAAPWPANTDATVSIGSGADGVVNITAEDLGIEGNDYDVIVALGAGNDLPLSAALVDGILTVTLGTDGSGASDPVKNTAILVAGTISEIDGLVATSTGTGAGVIPTSSSLDFEGGAYDERKTPALIMAAQYMEALIVWTGWAAASGQRLGWPRTGMMDRHQMYSISQYVIPDEVKAVQFELARLLIHTDRTTENEVVVNGITYLRAGPVTLKFREYDNYGASVIPNQVLQLLPSHWYEFVEGLPEMNRELFRA